MTDPIRVAVLGTGQMGTGIARLVVQRPGLELVGVCARRPERAGRDLGEVLGLDASSGLAVEHDLPAMLARARPRVVVQATCSRLEEARREIEAAAGADASVVSIAEELAFPAATDPRAAEALHRLAVDRGVAILGTGINPGFVLDLLVIVLTGVCGEIRTITARRVNDLSPYGPSVLRAQGVGLSPEAFRAGVADGTVVGHFGFPQSIGMIARALGWEIERIEQTREPIVSTVRRETPFVTVAPGQVAGCHHTAVAFRGGQPAITLLHPQQVHPELEEVATGDAIDIAGTPDIHLATGPEIPGGTGTIALAVNAVARVAAGPPGLHTMADLPPLTPAPPDARPSPT